MWGQTWGQTNAGFQQIIDHLDSADARSFRTDFFLNRGFLLHDALERQKNIVPGVAGENFVVTNEYQWKYFRRGLQKAAIRPNRARSEFDGLLTAYHAEDDDRVPVGVIFSQGELLKPYEVDENVEGYKHNRPVQKVYEHVGIFSAAVLKRTVYSGQVTFDFPEALFLADHPEVTSVEIDLADGNGFQQVHSGGSVKANYISRGQKAIAVKFNTLRGEVLSYSTLNIGLLERETPDHEFDLSASGNSETARTAAFSGGTAQLYTGCDQVLDRPVIIVEEFDPLNERGISYYKTEFATIESDLKKQKRDVIYLNFTNGGGDIRTNSNVLKSLLQSVNALKIGTEKTVVIGVGMGGVIARHCLAKMEADDLTHNVSHQISIDAPHLGANIPVGFQTFATDFNDAYLMDLFNISIADVDKVLSQINNTAARQLLLRYKGTNPHAEFTSLQAELALLGFPAECRNLAITNGSSQGTQQAPVASFNPGNVLFQYDAYFVGNITTFLKIRTNGLNTSTKVSSIVVNWLTTPLLIKEKTYSFNGLNYDLTPGGYLTSTTGEISLGGFDIFNVLNWFNGTSGTNHGRDRFCFVPLFSSLASTGPQNTQSDLQKTVNQIKSNGWTPFNKVYADLSNSEHPRLTSFDVVWFFDLYFNELGLSNPAPPCSQSTMPVPPMPVFSSSSYEMCEYDYRVMSLQSNSTIANYYIHTWVISGNGVNQTYVGDQLTVAGLPPGYYTITCTRSYGGGLSGSSSAYSRTFSVIYAGNAACCPNPPCHEARILNETKPFETFEKNGFIFWPNPAKTSVTIKYHMESDGEIEIKLIPVITNGKEWTLTKSHRPEGSYQETYYVNTLNAGLYLLSLTQNGVTRFEKILISNQN